MKKQSHLIVGFSLVVLLLGGVFLPSIVEFVRADVQPPRTSTGLKVLVEQLMAATPYDNRTDTDGDGLYDMVEAVIGTDFNNTDSDFDLLGDYFEILNDSDPLDPDSNSDGLSDYNELYNVSSLDVDGDNVTNVWDFDNDGDGLNDEVDLSPFSRSDTYQRFHFDIEMNGKPTYITLQFKPKNPESLKLYYQLWDWPFDREGSMKDMDNSKEDVRVAPQLNLTVNVLPDQSDVADYGILVTDNGMHVPVYPVWENDAIVAFTAQIFYNSSSPMLLSMDAELIWRVIGFKDEEAKALTAYNGLYVSVAANGELVANAFDLTSLETFLWVELGENKVALKVRDGPYLSVSDDGRIFAESNEIGSKETFELVDKGSNMTALKAYNSRYVSVVANGTLVANSSSIGSSETFELADRGYLGEWTILVTYNEGFMLTGLTVSESYGSDLGLFYSDDRNQTIRANLLLGYDFLRNSTTHLSDMPSILEGYSANISSLTGSFSNKDEALVYMSNTMLPEALSSLPPSRILPVIIGVEEELTMVEMSQLASGSYIMGDSYFVDLTKEPLITTKTLKANFYNTISYSALEIEEIMLEVNNWQLSEEARFSASSLVLTWNTGEQTVTKMGSQEISAQAPDAFVAVPISFESMMLLARGGLGLKAYQSLKLLRLKGWNSASITKLLKTGSKAGGFRLWAKMCNKLSKAKEGWAGIKGIKSLQKLMKGLDVLGVIVDVGLSILAGFMIADQIGGHLGKAIGAGYGIIAASYAIIYAAILFAIGEIPYVGWIISLAIVLADIFGGFSDKLMGWLMKWFGPKDLAVVEPWLEEIGMPNITIWDKDNNGLDVGDRFSVTLSTTSKVNVTSGRETYWASLSWYRPYVSIDAPPGSFSNTSMTGIPPAYMMNVTYGSNWKTEEYETGAWIEPGIGMPNFPVSIRINFDYGLWHIWEHFVFYVFYWEWCRHQDLQSGTSSSIFTTLYYDVLPGSIDDFAKWRGITPLDHDGDGIIDVNETNSDPWRFDTDADGLNDKFEVAAGTDPRIYDTDRDGLIDKFEFVYDTNATNRDTDGDGLSDYIELAGWVIAFNYFGDPTKPFTMRVCSDPRVPDTDGDGVDDYLEYWSDLNPRSQDTDGDGIKDVANPKFSSTTLDFVNSWNIPLDIELHIRGVAVDANGYVYVIKDPTWYGGSFDQNDTVSKFDSNGTLITTWVAGHEGYLSQIAVDNKNGYLYLSDAFGVHRYDFNGTYIASFASHSYPYWMTAMTVDADGYIYVGGNYYYPSTPPPWPRPEVAVAYVEKFDPNGTIINSWGSFGAAPDQIISIDGLAVDADNGYIYISDNGYTYYGRFRDDRVAKFDTSGNYLTSLIPATNFSNPTGMTIDADGCVYIADTGNNRIQKFNSDGMFIASWGNEGYEDGNFSNPVGVAVDLDGYVYVVDEGGSMQPSWQRNGRVQKFSQTMEGERPEDTAPDRDGDGLEKTAETSGWNVTFTNATNTFTIHVTSDPLLNDTDFDGLTDYQEYNMTTNPRDPDTDDDGVSDLVEYEWHHSPGMNPSHYDTDGDGLDDAAELAYGSDPTKKDTDSDGLSDLEEFLLNSDPNDTDTDDDGLSDYFERYVSNSSLTSPDSDGDFNFDGAEFVAGTDPWNNDTDDDGLLDGHEIILGTGPLSNDTDGDNLTDGFEVDLWLNPLSNDTDGDGLLDSAELEKGTDPWNRDSDFDGIPDGEDLDSNSTQATDLILAFDPDNATYEFAENLAKYTNVTVVSKDELLMNYTNAPRIVLVGRPDGNGTVGNLVHDLLLDSGDVLNKMIESDASRFAVRYGIWNSTQTVVMLAHPGSSDHLRILDILRSKIVTILPDSAVVTYNMSLATKYPSGGSLNHTDISYNFFAVDEIDTVKATDSIIYAILEETVNPTVKIMRYNASTTPFELSQNRGLGKYELEVGRYLNITLSENVQTKTSDIVESAYIQIYYKESDLDRTGNGYVGNPEDLNETTLKLYFFNETSGHWTKLEDSDWALNAGVNTTDVELYGENYAGYVWAQVTHFSLYGLAAMTFNRPPDVSQARPSIDYLWPANNKFIDVTILGVTDPDGDNVTITITGITSDEPTASADGVDGAKHAPDAYGVGTDTAWLRAERSGTGNGRVYVITFVASDLRGRETEGTVSVYVPHDMRHQCIDDGQKYDATKINYDTKKQQQRYAC